MNIQNGLYIKTYNIFLNFDIKGSYITYMYNNFIFLAKHHQWKEKKIT
jgi:hypothetical protein